MPLHYTTERRVHYEESCRLDRPADNLRDIPVISRVPDALLSRVLSPTGDRQFGIALMPAACPIGGRTAGFVGWQAAPDRVIRADINILVDLQSLKSFKRRVFHSQIL